MQVLTGDTGRRFNTDTSEKFSEATEFDGHNHVSLATGQWYAHEALYRTAGGRWILHTWSQWEGVVDTWIEIDGADAARWLSVNGHESHPACAAEFAALEIA